MLTVLNQSWALLLGVMLMMVGNGIQGTLLGIRGSIEGFSTFQMSLVMAGYFLGFLGGSRATPWMIQRVGHVRVFAALGSFISAVLILYPTLTNPIAWTILRIAIGFCFSGVYITAESWLNNATTNATRGKALSLYLIVQMIGIIVAQQLVLLGDPSGFVLFILPSVLVSVAFAPILLSASPTPAFGTTRRITLKELFAISPLGLVGTFFLGAAYSAQFGMAAVFGTSAGLSVGQLAIFVSAFYAGGLILQYPIGWISDRMDRRRLIVIVSAIGGAAALLPVLMLGIFPVLVASAFLIGGMTNPLYALLIAHTNDHVDYEDMAATSAGLMFVNGIGSVLGPIASGYVMTVFGPGGFFAYMAFLLLALVGYGVWRSYRSEGVATDDTQPFVGVLPQASQVAMELAQEVSFEAAEAAADSEDAPDQPPASAG